MNPARASSRARSIRRYASALVGVCSLAMFRPANRSSTLPIPTRGTPAAASRSSSVVPTGSIEKSLRRGVRSYEQVARDRTRPVELVQGDRLLVSRHLEDRVGRGVDDPLPGALMLRSQLGDDLGA